MARRRQVILSSVAPDNKSFELWFNELQIKRGFYTINKQWIAIPEGWQVVMEQKPIQLIIKDFAYSVLPSSVVKEAHFDFVLSPDNFNDYFFSINHLNKNNEMESLPGLLLNSQQFGADGKRLRLLVTESLEYDAQWLQLLSSAHARGIHLEFIILPDVVMPSWVKSELFVNVKQASHPKDNIEEARFIVCENAISTVRKLVTIYPDALPTCINLNTEPNALWSKFNKNERGEVFIDNSDVLQWLLDGKTVIVQAEELHHQLISRIATLLLPEPYALINGQKIPVTGKLILVSAHEVDLPVEEKVELGTLKYPSEHYPTSNEQMRQLAQQHQSTRSYLKVCAKKAMEFDSREQEEVQQPPSKKYKENSGGANVRSSESPSTMFYHTSDFQDRERKVPVRGCRGPI